MQYININKFYWWMSESDAYTSDSMSAYQFGVDGRSQPEVLKLNKKIDQDFSTWTNLMFRKVALDFWINDVFFVFWENWQVYDKNWVNVYTLPWNHNIYNAIKFWESIIFFYEESSQLKLWQVPVMSWNTPDWWNVTAPFGIDENLNPFAVNIWFGFSPYCVAINDQEDILYFIWWNSVYSALISQLPLIKKSLVLESQVVWLTKQGSQYSVYLSAWRKYFRDWFSEQNDWYIDIWERIRYVKDARNYDYVVTWIGSPIYSKLYLSQWQSFQPVKKASQILIDWFLEFKHAYDIFSPYWNDSIWIDESNAYISNWDSRWIEAFWNRIQWLPQWTSLEFAWEQFQDIWAIWYNTIWERVYFTYKNVEWDAFVSFIEYWNTLTPKYQLEWHYYTKKYVMWVNKIRQPLLEMRYETPENTQIEVYVSTDWDGNYELLKTISDDQKNIKIS